MPRIFADVSALPVAFNQRWNGFAGTDAALRGKDAAGRKFCGEEVCVCVFCALQANKLTS